MPQQLTYIDLFAGCGGFSLGLERAGFSLALAVEKSAMAAETYYHNIISRITAPIEWDEFADPSTSVEMQAQQKLVVKELATVLDCERLMRDLARREIDVVVGGPPCQGFSSAGRRDPNDARNMLPWQFLRFVERVRPKAVVIENVSGMQHDFKKQRKEAPFKLLMLALASQKPRYIVQPVMLNALDYGVPQNRPRLMLIALRADIAEAAGVRSSADVWKSGCSDSQTNLFPRLPSLAPPPTHSIRSAATVLHAVGDLGPSGYRSEVSASAYAKLMRATKVPAAGRDRRAVFKDGPPNHVFRMHSESVQTRFRLYQYFRDHGIPYKALGLLRQDKNAAQTALKAMLSQRRPGGFMPARAPDGTVLARSTDELLRLVLALQTKKHSQRALSWDGPSYTVMSVPDDMVHPDEARTMTVRELARFQSFPDSFEFRAKATTGGTNRRFEVPQYTQVANAVPPLVAEAVGRVLREAILAASKRTAVSKGLASDRRDRTVHQARA